MAMPQKNHSLILCDQMGTARWDAEPNKSGGRASPSPSELPITALSSSSAGASHQRGALRVSSLRCGPLRGSDPGHIGVNVDRFGPSCIRKPFWRLLRQNVSMSGVDELAQRLHGANRAPFLFVGAGISRRYLRTDGWIDLLKRMADMTPRPYGYYATRADNRPPRIATEIATVFHETWWNDGRFEKSRNEFSDTLKSREGPLKVEVAKYTRSALDRLADAGASELYELDLLSRAVVDGAITTNYDELLEHIYPEYKTFVGQDGLLFSDTQGIGEIYKIHGSASDPESLVLTADDYERFNERNPYLAAKLLTIFVEHPVIFLGYSLNDEDVTDILVSVARVLTTENLSRLQDHLIFVQWESSVRQPTLVATQIAASGFTIPVLQLTVADFVDLFEALGGLERKFPAQMLRQLKEHVYDLVMTNDPQTRLHVVDIEDTKNARELDVVFGVGVKDKISGQGYVGLSRRDLLLDVLKPSSEFEPARVVDEALPKITSQQRAFTPVFRYLREAGRLRDDGSLAPNVSVSDKVVDRVKKGRQPFMPARQQQARADRLAHDAGDQFETLAANNNLGDTLLGVLALPGSGIDLDNLAHYLQDHSRAYGTNQSSAWAKAVCLYDYLRFAVIPPKS